MEQHVGRPEADCVCQPKGELRAEDGGDTRNLVSFFSLPTISFLDNDDRGGLKRGAWQQPLWAVDGGGQTEDDADEKGDQELDCEVEDNQGFRQGGDARGMDVMMGAITPAQRLKHRGWVKQLEPIQTGAGLVRLLENLRTTKHWKYSTTSTKIGEILGAVKRLELYDGHRRLKDVVASAVFADYKRGIHLRALEEEVSFPVPLTAKDVEQILENLAVDCDWETCVALALQWGTAARPNCVLQLQVKNIAVEHTSTRVRFVAGKGVTARGEPYTVHTSLGRWATAVKRWLNQRGQERFVFNRMRAEIIKQRVRDAMRQVNSSYGLRSVRRGAAISLATQGTPLKVIMHFTGHRSEATCLRYLDWGWNWGEMNTMGTQASTVLWDGNSSESSSLDV